MAFEVNRSDVEQAKAEYSTRVNNIYRAHLQGKKVAVALNDPVRGENIDKWAAAAEELVAVTYDIARFEGQRASAEARGESDRAAHFAMVRDNMSARREEVAEQLTGLERALKP